MSARANGKELDDDAVDFDDEVEEAYAAELRPDEDRLRRRLEDIADADMRNLVDENNAMLPVHRWPDREARAVQDWNYNEKTKVWRVKFADPMKAIEALAKLDALERRDGDKGPLEEMLDGIPRGVLQAVLSRLASHGAGGGEYSALQARGAAGANGAADPAVVGLERPAAADDEFDPI